MPQEHCNDTNSSGRGQSNSIGGGGSQVHQAPEIYPFEQPHACQKDRNITFLHARFEPQTSRQIKSSSTQMLQMILTEDCDSLTCT